MASEDRYQIVRDKDGHAVILGKGGMGVVYLANDTLLKRKVAIKTIKSPKGEDAQKRRDAVQRLIREAQAAASLKHPHIVNVHDVIPDGNSSRIIMEYVRGKTLEKAAPLGAPASPPFALRVLRECASALDYAHGRRLVHRDFKPGNVMLDEAGSALIMDFGIAKLLDSRTDLTHGNVIGTLEYMSPEQRAAEPVDARSDQYSLAVVAYRLLTGCRFIFFQDPAPASERNPGLPQAVDGVLGKALAKKAAERYGSCMEFVTKLEASLLPVPDGPPKPDQDGIATVQIPAVIVRTGPKVGDVQVGEIDNLRYRWIPPGTFLMGCSPGDEGCRDNEKPAHEVTISRGFWMGETAVTVGAYKRYAEAESQSMPSAGDDNLPLVSVTWSEASSYCKWAGGRLPTEAEWEYAARAGAPGARYGNLDDIAWYGSNSGGGLKPVGQKQPNAFGLFDTLGNVWEWTADWFSEEYYKGSEREDPVGPPNGTSRALRGGAWGSSPRDARVSCRNRVLPGDRGSGVGFRCVGDAGRLSDRRWPEPAGITVPPGVPCPLPGSVPGELSNGAPNINRLPVLW
jgi:hypothetical protein